MNWKSMHLAPKDGTVICALYRDFRGVKAIRWGETLDGREVGWFNCKFDYMAEADQAFAGWVRLPQVEAWHYPLDADP